MRLTLSDNKSSDNISGNYKDFSPSGFGLKVSVGLIFAIALLCLSVFLFSINPIRAEFNRGEFELTIAVAACAIINYFYFRQRENFLDFDTLFVIICYIMGVTSTLFYGTPLYGHMFFFDFDFHYINSSCWIFCIGMCAFFVGNMLPVNKAYQTFKIPTGPVPVKTLFIIFLILVCSFTLCGGFSYYRSIYASRGNASGGITTYILLLIIILGIILSVIDFYNKRHFSGYRLHRSCFIIIIFFSLFLMIAGNRTAASQMLLSMIGVASLWFYPIRKFKFIGFIVGSFVLMWVFQQVRTGSNASYSLEHPIFIASDFIGQSRVSCEAMEYVDQYGFTYGKSMSSGILGLVPGLNSCVATTPEFSSAELLTEYTYAKLKTPYEYRIGLGTNIIADIYLSFGLIGVIVLMGFLGHFSRLAMHKAYHSLNWAVVYATLMGNSVFLIRASFTHPVRYIIWGVLILFIYRSIFTNGKCKICKVCS